MDEHPVYKREPLPFYAGINSFFRAPHRDFEDIRAGDLAVVGVPIDVTSSARPGSRWGPEGIRRESLYLAAYYSLGVEEILDLSSGTLSKLPDEPRIMDLGDVNVYPTDVARQTQSIVDFVAGISSRGGFPLILGGDHYVCYPGFEGFAAGYLQRHPKATFGYLHLDSHTDFIDEISFLGRYNHGTSARRISENERVKRMAWVGINWPGRIDMDQFETMRKKGYVMFPSHSVNQRGIEPVMREALDVVADGTDAIYVSLDIDVVDGAFAPATHSQVFGGLTSAQFLDAMHVLAEHPKIAAIDLCEVCPMQDGSKRTERLAAAALLSAIGPRILDTRKLDDWPTRQSAVVR